LKGMRDEDTWEYQLWLIAIETAANWHDPSEGDFGDTSDLRPLAALFRAGVPVPRKLREPLADLLERHRLKAIGARDHPRDS
jgi:hypothetical protein